MKVSELIGEQLSYWVAKAQGWKTQQGGYMAGLNWVNEPPYCVDENGDFKSAKYRPDQDSAQAFELIEKFGIEVKPIQSRMDGSWYAHCKYYDNYRNNSRVGSTPQEAICRAVVASVYGEEVSDG